MMSIYCHLQNINTHLRYFLLKYVHFHMDQQISKDIIRGFCDGYPHAYQLHTKLDIFYGNAFNYMVFMENVAITDDHTPHK